MSTKLESKAGVRLMAVLGPAILTALLPIGCGEESQPAKAPSVSSVQGVSFDVSTSSQKVEATQDSESTTPAKPDPVSVGPRSDTPAAVAVVAPPAPDSAPTQVPVPEPTLSTPTAVVAADPLPPTPNATAQEPKKEPSNDPPVALSFVKLASFRYFAPANRPKPGEAAPKSPIPASVRALDGKKVTIEGYMIPVDLQKGKVLSFLLSRSTFGCCYADSPQITEVIKVISADGKSMPYLPMPRVTGTLEVGEEYYPEGYIDSIYRIRADAVTASPER